MKSNLFLILFLGIILFNIPIAFAQNITTFLSDYCYEGGDLSTCLQGLYNLGVSLAVVIAFIFFILGAFKNLISTIPDVKLEGKSQMINALIGLAVIFISGIILYWINPFIFNPTLLIYKVTELRIPGIEIVNQGSEISGNENPDNNLISLGRAGNNRNKSGVQYNKPLIKQNDPNWAAQSYRHPTCGNQRQTIGSSGCGIASLAMAIAYYEKTTNMERYKDIVTSLSREVVERGHRTCNQGTSHQLYTDNVFLRKWKIRGRLINKNNIEEAKRYLSQDKIIIAAMGGSSGFTERGHYITIVGISSDNKKFLINDPGPRDVKEADINCQAGNLCFDKYVKAMWVILPAN